MFRHWLDRPEFRRQFSKHIEKCFTSVCF